MGCRGDWLAVVPAAAVPQSQRANAWRPSGDMANAKPIIESEIFVLRAGVSSKESSALCATFPAPALAAGRSCFSAAGGGRGDLRLPGPGGGMGLAGGDCGDGSAGSGVAGEVVGNVGETYR